MKRILTILVLVLTCTFVYSQKDQRIAKSKTPLSTVPVVQMPIQDNAALLEAEMERRGPGTAPKFAVNLETNITPQTHGQWDRLSNGRSLWRLKIESKHAKSLNLGFTKYYMPRGGTLILYTPDQSTVMGPFTPSDNEEHEQLWTPILDGEALVIEVVVPEGTEEQLGLELKYVNHDFVGFSEMASGSCNLDVICGELDGWAIVEQYRDIIQSVAAISTGGSAFCTGFLINNARQDCTPYFMTANHCGIGSNAAASLVTYWNFESNTCRQPNSPASGGNGGGSLADFNTGSILRASWAPSDFTLVELDDPVSETANGFFAGWTTSDTAPTDTVICVHHPSGDEKRISFEFDATLVSDYLGTTPMANGDHITVLDWDIGTTEGGSSGSPLFNRFKQVVGQLHGGFAACGNDDLDSYGWFTSSWEGGGTPTTRLRDWLDPDNTGITELDGRSVVQCNFFVDATPSSVELCAPDPAQFTIMVSANFMTDVDLTVAGLPIGLNATFETNPVAPGESTILTISNTNAIGTGSYGITVNGTDGTDMTSTDLTLNISDALPAAPGLMLPADMEMDVATAPTFAWEDLTNSTFAFEIATDAGFTDIIESAMDLNTNEFQLNDLLDVTQTYFWRVRGTNICGEGDWSTARSFTTGAIACAFLGAMDLPINISPNGTPQVSSTIEIPTGGAISDINVNNINITHSWVSDLRIELTSPDGMTIELMNNVGGGDCDANDIAIGFDDDAANTYAMLDGMCNQTPPALSGVFQPSIALSAFQGMDAAGPWTLTVFDDANQDGGAITNWELEICSIIPNDRSISLSSEEIISCTEATTTFNITLGAGFDDANGINLTANNLPAGAMATFDPNPATPGAQVTVTMSGATESGIFDIEIVGDDGIETGSANIQWTVNGTPDIPIGMNPAQGAIDVPLNTSISWMDVVGDGYEFILASDPDFTENVVMGNGAASSFQLNGLAPCTTYYWQVVASNECGLSDAAETYSFTTEDDLTFATTQSTFLSCNLGTILIPVSVGPCFEANGLNLSVTGVPMGADATFLANPVFSGDLAELELMLNSVVPGVYPITISGTDGVNDVSTTFNLQVEGPAALANLFEPTNGETEVDIEPVLVWDAVVGANNYLFELATDDGFTDIVYQVTQTQTTVTLPNMLEHLTTYYWRVTSFNDCGGTTTAPFSFLTEEANAVVEVAGFNLEILPNPTDGRLVINSISPLNESLRASVFSINGIHLMDRTMDQGTAQVVLDLTAYPAGVYLLKMTIGATSITERIILK